MYYTYKVKWYSDYQDEELDDCGIVGADSYGQAAAYVAKDYEEDEVIDLTLHAIVPEFDSYSLTKEDIDYAFSHMN